MKTLILISIAMLLGFSNAAMSAQEAVDESRPVNANGYVRINIVRGEVEIEGWDKNEVSVTGTLDESTEKFIFEVKGNDTTIAVKLPERLNSWCCDRETDLVIKVPTQSNLVVSLVSAEAQVKNVHGGLELGSVSGELRVENVSDRVRVTNISGEVSLRKVAGRARVKTVSGDIVASGGAGPGVFSSVSGSILVSDMHDELDLESVSGDIEVTRSHVRSVRANTVSGDVELAAEMQEGAIIECDTMSGSVRLVLGGKIDARFDVETSSGRIRNRITSDKPRASEYVRDETLRFTMGDGKGEVIASSGSGDISLSAN